MATLEKLPTFLSSQEIDTVPVDVRKKIEEHFIQLNQLVSELKKENAENSAISEQQQFQFQQELADVKTQLDERRETCGKLQTEFSETSEKLNALQIEWRALQNTSELDKLELQSLKKSNELILEEKQQLVNTIEKRNSDVEQLQAELKGYVDKITQLSEEKHDATSKVELAELRETTLKHNVNRLERETSLLEKQILDMNMELQQKNHEIHTLKREKSTAGIELQAQLEQRVDEVHFLQQQVNSLKEISDEKDRRIEALAEKIRNLNDVHNQMEEQFQLELNSQTKLTELFKAASETNQDRVYELVTAFEESQKVLQNALKAKTDAEENLQKSEEQHKQQSDEKGNELDKLKNELKNANDLVQGKAFSPEIVESLFPTAAATSKVMRSGMTLTQMYSEYIRAQEQMQNLKYENTKLTEQLNKIVDEIQENTPIINQKMQEYHKAMETVGALRSKLSSSMTDFEMLQSEKNDLRRSSEYLKRENGRLKTAILDLNRQVQVLLKEIEESRGRYDRSGDNQPPAQVSSSDDVSADVVITKHLVTFRDIIELQTNNQKLLAVVRDLSEQQEELEKNITNEKNAELEKELKNAMLQLEELQKNRVKQADLVNTIIRQRDMYRVLLSNQDVPVPELGSPHGSPVLCSTKLSLSPEKGADGMSRSAISQLQTEFTTYKKEKADNDRLVNEQMEKLRNDLSDAHITNSKLSSQLEFSEERISLIQSNMENYKKEAIFLRDKNQQHTVLMTQHQQTIHHLQEQLMDLREKSSKNAVLVENLKAERDLLRGVEQSLIKEKELLLHEQQQKSQVLIHLQAVQNNLERLESETKRNMQFQIEKYEKENSLLKVQLENSREEYLNAVRVWEKQTKDLQHRIDEEGKKNEKLHNDLVDAYSKYHSSQQELQLVKTTSSNTNVIEKAKAPAKIVVNRAGPQAAADKNLQQQLSEAQAAIKALKEQLQLSQKSCENYQSMSSDLELRLKEQDEINKQLSEKMTNDMNARNDVNKDLAQSLENMEKSYHDLIEENIKLVQDRDAKVLELQGQVNKLLKEVASNESSVETASKTAAQAREDCVEQGKQMKETQEKYERELMLHAEDVRALNALKEEHMKCTTKIDELAHAASEARSALEDQKELWNSLEKLLIDGHETLKQRAIELQTQNENLLHQLDLLGTTLSAIQSKDWENVPSAADTKDAQHLIQVIQFLKREKEIVNTQLDSVQSEKTRLKLKCEQLESELAENKKEMQELQNITQSNALSQAQHADLLRKIEMMNLLTESNNLLRIEKNNLNRANAELEEKLKKLGKDMQPMSETQKQLRSQLETFRLENLSLKQDVRSWQSRTNQLLEQSHRIGPLEYKNLTREVEELKSQKARLADEIQRKQTEVGQLTTNLNMANKDIQNLRIEMKQQKETMEELMRKNEELQATVQTVQKIGRKYKNQFMETKASYEKLVEKNKASETTAAHQQEIQKKLEESEKMAKAVIEESEKLNESLKGKETALKDAVDKEEKTKKLLQKLRSTLVELKREKETIAQEKEVAERELEEGNKLMTEEKSRCLALKTQTEAKIQQLERSLKMSKETIEQLEKQNGELAQKQKQSTKPTAVGGMLERGSGAFEPLTANIKPLSSPQSLGSGLRHTTHTATPSTRTTPTASIRPMAIGTSSTASLSRMAAILPTTSSTCSLSSSAEEDISSTITSTVPQATVQPTPVTATVAPTLVLSDMTPISGIQSDMQNTPAVEVVAPTHIVALVGPRVEGLDSIEANVESPAAPTASVIVSPPTTQTQLVQPTLKRTRDESQVTFEASDPGPSSQKKVRTVSEGSQTNQQVTITSMPQPIIAVTVSNVVSQHTSEVETSDSHTDVQQAQPVITPTFQSPVHVEVPEVIEISPDVEKVEDDEPDILEIEDRDDPNDNWLDEDESKPGDVEVEEMVSEGDSTDPMDEFDDPIEEMPFQPAEDEECMGDDPLEVVEEMADPSSDACIEVIEVLDNSPEHTMEADSSSLQALPSDQSMAPPSFPLSHASDASSVPEGIIGQRTVGQIRTQRLTIRHDRLPSTGRQHFTPLTISGQGPNYEEGDDSIVPSTPTLFLPRRADGFAEAVSSPHVPPGRFLFSGSDGSPTQQGLSQLASQGALGVDDTRMDLSQFDDGGNRTVPSTPLQTSPPVLSETEVPDIVTDQPIEPVTEVSLVAPIIVIDSSEIQDEPETERQDMIPISTTQLEVLHAAEAPKSETDSLKSTEEDESTEPVTVPISSGVDSSPDISNIETTKLKESETQETPSQSQTLSTQQTQRKPIVWETEKPSSAGASAATSASITPAATVPQISQFHSPGTSTTTTRQTRRVLIHRNPSTRGSRGRGSEYNWPRQPRRAASGRRASRRGSGF